MGKLHVAKRQLIKIVSTAKEKITLKCIFWFFQATTTIYIHVLNTGTYVSTTVFEMNLTLQAI